MFKVNKDTRMTSVGINGVKNIKLSWQWRLLSRVQSFIKNDFSDAFLIILTYLILLKWPFFQNCLSGDFHSLAFIDDPLFSMEINKNKKQSFSYRNMKF